MVTTPSQPQPFIHSLSTLAREIFQFSLITYLVLLFIDLAVPGYVSDHFNLTILLVITLISGVVTVVLTPGVQVAGIRKEISGRRASFVPPVILGVLSAGYLYYQTRAIGWFAAVLAVAGGILTAALLHIFMGDGGDIEQ